MVISELGSFFKGPGTFPEGYDTAGKSLYYDGRYPHKRSPLYRRPISSTSPILRFGQVEELELCGEALEEYIRTSYSNNKVPVYIFDDHNHALFAWCEALKEGRIEKGATLLHFDYHSDLSKPKNDLCGIKDLEKVADYSHSLDCGSFIEPALSAGLIGSAYWIKSCRDGRSHLVHRFESVGERGGLMCPTLGLFDDFRKSLNLSLDPKKTILDIDLDYFKSLISDLGERKEIEKFRKMMLHAGVITLVTSPGYISSQRAISFARELLKR